MADYTVRLSARSLLAAGSLLDYPEVNSVSFATKGNMIYAWFGDTYELMGYVATVAILTHSPEVWKDGERTEDVPYFRLYRVEIEAMLESGESEITLSLTQEEAWQKPKWNGMPLPCRPLSAPPSVKRIWRTFVCHDSDRRVKHTLNFPRSAGTSPKMWKERCLVDLPLSLRRFISRHRDGGDSTVDVLIPVTTNDRVMIAMPLSIGQIVFGVKMWKE